MLKPVNEFQHASEADGAGIAHVVNRWLQIKSKWSEMGEADQFPDIPWDDIDAIFKARLDKQTYESYMRIVVLLYEYNCCIVVQHYFC